MLKVTMNQAEIIEPRLCLPGQGPNHRQDITLQTLLCDEGDSVYPPIKWGATTDIKAGASASRLGAAWMKERGSTYCWAWFGRTWGHPD